MKQFKLIEIDNDNNINARDDDDDYGDEKYNDMKQAKQEPVVSTVEKKRSNKTEQCPKCKRYVNKKTLLYSHKCKALTAPPEQPAQTAPPAQPPPEQPQPASAQQLIPTEQDIHNYILNQQKQRMQQLKEIRQAKFDNLISRAF